MPAELPAEIPADWPSTSGQQQTTGTVGDDSSSQESQTFFAVLPATFPRPATRREHHDDCIGEITSTEADLISEKLDYPPARLLPDNPSDVAARNRRDDDGFEDDFLEGPWDIESVLALPHILEYPGRYGTFLDEDAAIEGRRRRRQLRLTSQLDVAIRAFFVLVGFVFIVSLLLYAFLR